MVNYITYIVIQILSKMISFLSREQSISSAKFLGLVINKIFPKRKKVAKKNLEIAFPNKTESEINSIIKLIGKSRMKSFSINMK